MLEALLITKENCEEYAMELNYAHPTINGYKPSYWIGYYLIVSESGMSLITAHKFDEQYTFLIDPCKFNPIGNK